MSDRDEEIPVLAGTVVDARYRIRREIARGGMGVVYEAEHVVLGDVVALKLLTSTSLDHPALRERIVREARALARVRHRGIVSIRDAGVCGTLGPYVALERLEGRPLDGILAARTRLSVPAVIALGAELGAALTHAHSVGIVHRDVKPGNVLVARTPGSRVDRAVLLDFGIARLDGDAREANSKLTRAGEVLGTPEYMAPEILLDGADPSPCSDVYALSALLYECLAGDVPHPGRVMAIMSALLVERSPASLAAVRSDVPAALESVIRRGLSRDPSRRPSSCQELAQLCMQAANTKSPVLELLDGGASAWRSAPLDPAAEAAPTVSRPAAPAPVDLSPISRRQHARAPYVAPARVVGSAGACDGRTEDVSEGGALIAGASARPAEGEEVTVRFPLPTSGRIVVLRAHSKWCRTRRGAHALGVEFIELPEAAREDIARYVRLMSANAPAEAGSAVAPPLLRPTSVVRL